MNPGKARYTARLFGSGHWRIWDRNLHQWLAEQFSSYPDQTLRDLNGRAIVTLRNGQGSRDHPRAELPHLVCLTFFGAILGGLMGVWLLMRAQSPQDEDGCGLFVAYLTIIVLFVGAILGGLLCLTAGLLYNTVADRRAFRSMAAAFDTFWEECPDDPPGP